MARPKKNSAASTPATYDEGVENSFNNAFTSFLSDTCDIESSLTDNIKKIPSGIDLFDTITDGGAPCKFSIFMGKPGSGKSSFIVNFIKTGQKLWGEKFIAVYGDSEESMTQKRLTELGCTRPVNIINGLTVEKLFKCIEGVCAFKASNPDILDIPSVIVWDSIANTMSQDTMESDELSNTDGVRRANVLAKLLPKYIDKLVKYNIALIAVNQYRVKISMGSMPVAADMRFMKQDQTAPGGQAVQFNAYQLFDVEQGPPIPNDPYGYTISPVKIRAIKNKAFTPNIPIQVNFNHSKGFSNFWTNYDFLKTQKFIEAGASCYLKSMPTKKFRQKQASTLYIEDSEWREAFNKDLETALANFVKLHSGGDISGIYWDPEYRESEKEPNTFAWHNKQKELKNAESKSKTLDDFITSPSEIMFELDQELTQGMI